MSVASPPRQHHWVTLALLTTAGLSFALMQTLVVPALPSFQREFGASGAWTTWVLSGFLLSSSVLTPILGKLGDAHGKRRLLVISLTIFGLGSLAGAAAPDLPTLIACRVLQGAGAAVFPLSFGIIRDEFPPEKVGIGIGTVSSVFGLGGGVGLVASGVILEHLDRHWLFLIGAIPVLAAAALIARCVPESPIRTPTRPDYRGGAALSATLVALLVGLSEGASLGWGSPVVLALFAAAAALSAVWVVVERRAPEPLVDLRTFARRGMAATNAATVLVGFSITAIFVLVPAFVQVPDGAGHGFGATTIQTGLFFIPFAVAMSAAGPLAGAVGGRYGRPLVLRLGLALSASAFLALVLAHGAVWTVCAALLIAGTGVAFSLAALGTLVIDHSAPGETGVAGGMNTIMRTTGGALGAQIAIAILTAATPAGSHVPAEHGFTTAFAVAAAGALLALVPAALVGTAAPLRPWARRRRYAPAVAPASSGG